MRTWMLAHWIKPRNNQSAIFQRLEGSSGFITMLTNSHAEGHEQWMDIRGLPTQSTTASGHKFGDRGYDNDKLCPVSCLFLITHTHSNINLLTNDKSNRQKRAITIFIELNRVLAIYSYVGKIWNDHIYKPNSYVTWIIFFRLILRHKLILWFLRGMKSHKTEKITVYRRISLTLIIHVTLAFFKTIFLFMQTISLNGWVLF